MEAIKAATTAGIGFGCAPVFGTDPEQVLHADNAALSI